MGSHTGSLKISSTLVEKGYCNRASSRFSLATACEAGWPFSVTELETGGCSIRRIMTVELVDQAEPSIWH